MDAAVARDTWVVVPVYNEATVIQGVLEQLLKVFPNVVAVDDGSSDPSFEAIRASGAHALQHLVNRGQGAAIQTGTDYALSRNAARIAHFDADGQHRIEDLITMVESVHSGECQIALGNRFAGDASQVPPPRRLLLRAAVIFHRIASGIALNDVHNGLRVLDRSAALKIEISADRMAHASEIIDLIARSECTVKEIPVTIRYSEYSRNKGQRWTGGFRILFHFQIHRQLG